MDLYEMIGYEQICLVAQYKKGNKGYFLVEKKIDD